MSYTSYSVLMVSLGLGTMVTLSSYHWFLAWMGLEINTLAILPLIAQMQHPRSLEAATKYFFAQTAASAVILFATIINAWETGSWNMTLSMGPIPSTLMVLALGLKLGLAPFHVWTVEVIQGTDLITGMILTVWQKVAPIILMYLLDCPNNPLLLILGLVSVAVGGWGGLNQIFPRKILAYSSVSHLGWMALIVQYNPSLSLLALIIYVLATSAAFLALHYNKITTLVKLATSWANNPVLVALIPIILLSLAGLPPLAGFAPKWFILNELMEYKLVILAFIIAVLALISLYYYFRISHLLALMMPPQYSIFSMLWRHGRIIKKAIFIVVSTTSILSLLPILPLLKAFFGW